METTIKSQERLGTLLLRAGVISEEDLKTALKLQSQRRGRLGETLIQMGALVPKDLIEVLARRLGVKGCVLRHGLVDPAVTRFPGRKSALREGRHPSRRTGRRAPFVHGGPCRPGGANRRHPPPISEPYDFRMETS